MRLLLAIFLLFGLMLSGSSPSFAQAATAIEVRAGELGLEGRVLSLKAARLSLEVTAFRNPNGKRGVLAAPKTKVITLPPTLDVSRFKFKVGDEVLVLGSEGGNAKEFAVRAISLLNGVEPQASPDTKPLPATEDKLLPPTEPVPASAKVAPQEAAPIVGFSAPEEWRAGALSVRVAKAGFQYTKRLMPGSSTLDTTPAFYALFEVSGAGPKRDIASLFNFRRVIGPRREFIRSSGFPFNITNLPPKGDIARFGFWSSAVDPSWKFADVDVDTAFTPGKTGNSTVSFSLDHLALPREGGETPINKEATSEFGTKYRVEKLEDKGVAGGAHHFSLLVTYQKPPEPHDLQVFAYSYGGGAFAGNGDFSETADHKLSIEFAYDPHASELPLLQINLFERSRQSQKRTGVLRRRVRFPLARLLQSAPPAPLDGQPPVLAQGEEGGVSVRLEGSPWSDDMTYRARSILFARGTPEDARKGLIWTIKGGKVLIGATSKNDLVLPGQLADFPSLWHNDATPKASEESVRDVAVYLANAPTYDLDVSLQSRLLLNTPLETTVSLPPGGSLVIPKKGDDEGTLHVRRVQRFSPDHPLDINSNFKSGVLFLFEADPLLGQSDFTAHFFDAEDDQGRALALDTLTDGVVGTVQEGGQRLYDVRVSEPAPDAKSITLWGRTDETGKTVREQIVHLKNVPFWKK